MDLSIDTFDDAIEYVVDMIGSEFQKSLEQANVILDNPGDFTGPQAAITAIRLANQRYKIGIAAQYWKNKSVGSQKRQDKLVKDALMTAYSGLEEVINTLKLTARSDTGLAGINRG